MQLADIINGLLRAYFSLHHLDSRPFEDLPEIGTRGPTLEAGLTIA